MKKIIKLTFDDGTIEEYEEKSIDYYRNQYPDEGLVIYKHSIQYINFEHRLLSNFIRTDLEKYAKDEFKLIDPRDCEDCYMEDADLKEEAIARGLFPEHDVENLNILNEDFVSRFINIVNTGNNTEIDKTLTELENKFRL